MALDVNTTSVFFVIIILLLLIIIIPVVIVIVAAIDLDAEELIVDASMFGSVEETRWTRRGRGRGVTVTRYLGEEAEDLEELAAKGGVIAAAMVGGRRESEVVSRERLDEAELALVADDIRLPSYCLDGHALVVMVAPVLGRRRWRWAIRVKHRPSIDRDRETERRVRIGLGSGVIVGL